MSNTLILNTTQGQVLTIQQGPPGAPGRSIRAGEGTPSEGLGRNGDLYINTLTGDLYLRADGEYSVVGSLQGPAGDDGDDGDDGREVELQATDTHIQWRYTGGDWVDLIALSAISGQDGQDGEDGEDGAAATITVGTTTTGEPNTPATVTNVGTDNAAVLNFTIPSGSKGDPGSISDDEGNLLRQGTDGGALLTDDDLGLSWTAPNYPTAELPENPADGDIAYDTTRKTLVIGVDGVWAVIEGGGGGVPGRTTEVVNFTAIPGGDEDWDEVDLGATYQVLTVASDTHARITLYVDESAREADESRPLTTAPMGDHRVIFDLEADTEGCTIPVPIGFTLGEEANILRVVNISGSTEDIEITLTALVVEP